MVGSAYGILGVSKNSSLDDVDKAFRKAEINNHPDNGGDPEKFKEIEDAYKILSHPLKRVLYDQYHDGDVGRVRLGRDVAIHPLMVSLEDLYNGTTLNIPLTLSVTCPECKGIGTNDEGCCQQCKGEKVVEDNKELEVHIEKGMQERQNIRFSGEALNTVSGGVAFILLEEEHPIFKRKGDDLFVELTLSAIQARWGFEIGLTHLDNREIIIQSPYGVKHDQVKVINDEGMPMYQRPFMRGKLYIQFKVHFSSKLTAEELELLRPSPQLTDMEEVDETTMDDVNIEDEMRRKMKICPPVVQQ